MILDVRNGRSSNCYCLHLDGIQYWQCSDFLSQQTSFPNPRCQLKISSLWSISGSSRSAHCFKSSRLSCNFSRSSAPSPVRISWLHCKNNMWVSFSRIVIACQWGLLLRVWYISVVQTAYRAGLTISCSAGREFFLSGLPGPWFCPSPTKEISCPAHLSMDTARLDTKLLMRWPTRLWPNQLHPILFRLWPFSSG